MSSQTIWTYVAAVVVGIVVAIATAGVGLGAYASFAGGLAFAGTAAIINYQNRPGAPSTGLGGSLGRSKASSVKDAAAGQLEMASAVESVAIPVVFGKVRMAGNFLRFDRSTFRTEPVIQKYKVPIPVVQVNAGGGGGGKGGGGGGDSGGGSGSKDHEEKYEWQEQVVGYKYYLSWDYGLCMGPIDAVRRVQSSPGELTVATGTTFSLNYQSVTAKGAEEGGAIRVYRGSADQSRVGTVYNTAGTNYRNVCFATFQNYWMGYAPAPKTYLFEVERVPVCLDADGVPVAGLKTRGSDNPTHPAYKAANPAAILYEVFTNKIWGRGLDPEIMDVGSFISASVYFAANNIGMSFTLESQDLVADVVSNVQTHCNTALVWNGEKIRCRCMLDRVTEYARSTRITSDQVTQVQFSRPAWPDVPNELRVEFVNAKNNYQREIVLMQDLAAINTVGLVNSQKVVLAGFDNRDTAEAQSARLLAEIAYPKGNLTFRMNRWNSALEPGDLVEFVWNEWSDGPATTFWRVAQIDDDTQDSGGIKVILSEDQFLTAYEGEGEPIVPSVPPFEEDTQNADDDLNQGDDASEDLPLGDAQPVTAWEQPPFMSGGDPDIIFTCERPAGYVSRMLNYWSLTASIDYQTHSATFGWALTGALLSNITGASPRKNCRETSDAFTFSLTNAAANEGALLGSANKVTLDADHLATLSAGGTDLLLIGNEIFQLGNVVEISPGVYQATNYLRACYGSKLEAHTTGDNAAFILAWQRSAYGIGLGDIPTGQPISLRSHAMTTRGESETNFDFVGPEPDGSFLGRGALPYTPGQVSHSVVGLNWTVALRPRWTDRGAAIEPNLETDLATLIESMPPGYSLQVEPFNGGSSTGTPTALVPVFVPDGGTAATCKTTGVLTFTFTAPATTDRLKVWAVQDGKLSLDAVQVGP